MAIDEPQMFAFVAMDGDNDGDDETQLLFFRPERSSQMNGPWDLMEVQATSLD